MITLFLSPRNRPRSVLVEGAAPIAFSRSLIWMLPVMTPPPVESAGLYSPPPVRKLSCCPAVAGGTRPLVPEVDTVAPSYSGTEMIPLLTVRPSPTWEDVMNCVQTDQDELAILYWRIKTKSATDE